MDKSARIFVAGSAGLVGAAISRQLISDGYTNLLLHTRAQLDLENGLAVEKFFSKERPEYVVLAAAKVGGIHANNTYPAEFIFSNICIQNNVIHNAWKFGVKRLLFLGSSCIYPKLAPQPMKEEHLLSGPLEPTNEPYAIAKIAGIKMCESYNRQYKTQFIAVMPTNLYGPGDNFHPENSHVLPALIRRIHEAKIQGDNEVTVWGTGTPRREFLHVDDMARGCIHLLNLSDDVIIPQLLSYPLPCFVNLGTGTDLTIRELVDIVCTVVGYNGKVAFDTTKPDGTPRKLLDVSRIHQLGWRAQIPFIDGVRSTYDWFVEHINSYRQA